MKQWKRSESIYRNPLYLNWKNHYVFSYEDIYKVANSKLLYLKTIEYLIHNYLYRTGIHKKCTIADL